MGHPTGTVTFLFTDIEGSTQRWERYPDAMQCAFNRHEQIIRQCAELHNGYPYKMIGDAFQIAFPAAGEALLAAIDAQHTLQAEPWGEIGTIRVRMALFTGVTEERGDDYVGPALNRAARLLSSGYGGQILLSQATEQLVRDSLPSSTSLRDMGEHRLKDLARPEKIFQVVAPDLSTEFPPLKTLNALPNNLPIQLTTFIGRQKEIEEIRHRLSQTRLLTLTGAGGCGKTRLALQVAAQVAHEFPNGAWMVELAPLADPSLVPQSIAAVFGLRQEEVRPLLETVIDYLREKDLLLILDNCEHLIDSCANLADRFLHACPRLKILASSREALGIAGETPYRVPSLSLPQKNSELDALIQSEAARLFIDRASALAPGFKVEPQQAPAITQICLRLDGIPLAIELAAARIKILSVEQIAQKLDDRFKLLTGGSRTALPRQQTLRALIDWSYSLLTESERILLRRLSVFAGGWSLEAAQAICSCDPVCEDDVLDLLAHLVDKSLVIAESRGPAARYRLMETIRQYARDKLLESSEAEEIRTRHLDFYLQFAQIAEPKLHGHEQRDWLDRLEMEHDNFRSALEWSTHPGCVERGMRLASALHWFWDSRGYWIEANDTAEDLLKQPEASSRTLARANLLLVAGMMSGSSFESKAGRQYLEEAVSIARTSGPAGRSVLALGLCALGAKVFGDDNAAGESLVEEGLAMARALDDDWIVAYVLYYQGMLFLGRRDLPRARMRFESSQKHFQSAGDERLADAAHGQINRVQMREGDIAGARRAYQQRMDHYRSINDPSMHSGLLNTLGELARMEGEYRQAKDYYSQALEVSRYLGSRFGIAIRCGNLAFAEYHIGELESARAHFRESLSLAYELIAKPNAALLLVGFALLALSDKNPRRAVQLIAVAQKFLEGGDIRTINPVDESEFEYALTHARQALDEEAFKTAWEEGQKMSMDAAIDLALMPSP